MCVRSPELTMCTLGTWETVWHLLVVMSFFPVKARGLVLACTWNLSYSRSLRTLLKTKQ